MPDPQWIDIAPPVQSIDSQWEDIPQPEPQQSTGDWLIEQGIRTAPAVIGSIGGGMLGGIPGGMAGGAGGAALGDVLGNWYTGRETNPWELGVTSAAGGMFPILGPAEFAGQGLGAIARYAGKSALRGAAEGAIVSGASTPFQSWAEGKGFLSPTAEDYLHNAEAGAAFGGALGGGMGAFHGYHLNKPTAPIEAATGGGEAPPDWLPFGELPPDARPPVVSPPEPVQQGLPFEDPHQLDLPFGSYRGVNGKFTNQGPGYKGPVHPALAEPLQQSLPMDMSGGQGTISIAGLGDATPPPVTPKANGELPQIVTISSPDAATIAMYRSQGYVPVPGLRSPEGYPQMVRGDVAPLYVIGERSAAPVEQSPVSRPEVPGAIGQEQVAAGDEIPVPNEKVTSSFVSNMAENGYVVAGKDSVTTIFKRFVNTDEGGMDHGEIWKNLKRMFGRDPTAEEVDNAIGREVQPHEQTGRVAPFQQPTPSMPDLVMKANGLVDQSQANSQRITRAIDWTNAKARELGINPDDFNSPAELFQHLKDMGVEAPSFDVQTAETPVKMGYRMPHDSRPLRGSEVGQLILDTPLTGNQRFDALLSRMKQIAAAPELTEQMLEELQTLGHEATRDPGAPPGFRQQYYSASSDPSGAVSTLGPIGGGPPAPPVRPPLTGPEYGAIDPNEPHLGPPYPDFPRDAQGNRIVRSGPLTPDEIRASYEQQLRDAGPGEDPFASMPGPEDPRWSDTTDISELRRRSVLGSVPMDPRMASRVEAGGPRSFDFTQVPNQEGQMELPWSRGENPQPIDADAANRELQAAADRFKRPQGEMPQQQNMLDLMADHELVTYLGLEDGKPPEATDLAAHAATVKAAKEIGFGEKVRTIAKDFLTDETGSVDTDEVIRRAQALNDRLRAAIGREPQAIETPEEAHRRQQRNDENEIINNTNLTFARQLVTFWEERTNVASRGNDNDAQKHAAQMERLATRRLEGLEETTPVTHESRGTFEVFNPATGESIARARDQAEALDIIANHPDGPNLDYMDHNATYPRTQRPQVYAGGEPPVDLHSTNLMNSERFDRVGHPYEVIHTGTRDSIGNFINQEQAQAYIDGNLDPNAYEARAMTTEQARDFLANTIGPEAASGFIPETDQGIYETGTRVLPPVDESHFNQLSRQWNQASRRYYDVGDSTRGVHADDMAALVEEHRRAAIFGEPRPNNPLPDPPDLSNLPRSRSELRAATGVLNPPIEFGLQDPKTLGEGISKAQLERLRGTNLSKVATAEERRAARRQTIKDRRLRKEQGLPIYDLPSERWGDFSQPYLAEAAQTPGPPGLVIENHSGHYTKKYHVVFRGPEGEPIAIAKVNENSDGSRVVPILAADRTKGWLYAKGVKQVLQALIKMNATEASGIISEHTANLIAQAARFIKEDAGSYQIGKVTEELLRIKNKILGGKPLGSRKITSVEDGLKLVDDMAGGKTGLPWMASKVKETAGKFIADETGAVPVPSWQGIKEATGWGQGESKAGKQKPEEFNFVKEALAVPSNATTMLDLSAPGRQGISMVLTPEFWKAGAAMFGSLHYDTFKQIDANLRSKPLMVSKIDLNTGKRIPSFGEQIGTKLYSPASESVGPRAEMTASRWLEMGFGNGIGSKIYRNTLGLPIRASNRAYITFLNHLNVNRTEKLLNLARDMSIRGLDTGRTAMPGVLGGVQLPGGRNLGFTQKVTPTEAMNLNPYHNLPLAKEIAEFVNTATGHGPLKTHILPFKQAEVSLEAAASKLGYVLFSPGLLASRVRMMNPSTYIMASPFVRKQYLKAALSTAAAWYVSTQLIKKAAGPEAEVSNDPTSADFGKVRIGDARLDLGGGFLQFATAYGRMYMGGSTSSASGQFHRFGSGYQAQTQEDTMERFFVNKMNPVAKFAWDVASASEYNPMHVGDRTMQLFVPLFHQDLMEIAKENPSLLPMFGTAAMFGGGSQIYSKGESVSKFIDPENDWNVTGGGVRDLMPWNWGNEQGQQPRTFPWSEPN